MVGITGMVPVPSSSRTVPPLCAAMLEIPGDSPPGPAMGGSAGDGRTMPWIQTLCINLREKKSEICEVRNGKKKQTGWKAQAGRTHTEWEISNTPGNLKCFKEPTNFRGTCSGDPAPALLVWDNFWSPCKESLLLGTVSCLQRALGCPCAQAAHSQPKTG